jgi:N-ethylmaleimide reductase
MKKMLSPFSKNGLSLKNHLVMAPMTRCRAIGNVPNELMAEYYGQRAGAGLIITEGTSPSPNGLGYCCIPGIFSDAQIAGWKAIADTVHQHGAKIFVQLMHCGRVGHQANLPEGGRIIAPSAIAAAGQMYTDTLGMQDNGMPEAMSMEDIHATIAEFVAAAKNAVAAGCDGVELHNANGYLLEQFLNPGVNTRTDDYGGSIVNRCRFVLTIATQAVAAIGKEKVGIRFSPFSKFNDMTPYAEEEVHATYAYLAEELDRIGIAYIHIGANPDIPQRTLDAIRANFSGTLILCNGLTPESGEAILEAGVYDLVAFGRSYISNPDFDQRIAKGAALAPVDFQTLYSPGAAGYTDYPVMEG